MPLCFHKHSRTCVRDLLLPLILNMRFHFSWMPFGKNGRNITSLRAGQQTYRTRVRPSYWEEDLPYRQAGSVRVVQFKAEDDTFQLLAKHISEEYYENAPSDVGQAKLELKGLSELQDESRCLHVGCSLRGTDVRTQLVHVVSGTHCGSHDKPVGLGPTTPKPATGWSQPSKYPPSV